MPHFSNTFLFFLPIPCSTLQSRKWKYCTNGLQTQKKRTNITLAKHMNLWMMEAGCILCKSCGIFLQIVSILSNLTSVNILPKYFEKVWIDNKNPSIWFLVLNKKKIKIDSSNKSYIRLETQMGTFYNSGKQKSISATVGSQTLKSKRTSGHCISETGPEKTGERPGKVFFSIYKPDC